MKLSETIGKKFTDVYVKYKLQVDGLDYANLCLELDGKSTIKFPWDFESVDLKKRKPWRSKSLKRTDYFKSIRNATIVDFLILNDDEPMSTGFFELNNGKVIYENTVFPTGAMSAGLNILPSVNSIKEVFDQDFIRYSENSS